MRVGGRFGWYRGGVAVSGGMPAGCRLPSHLSRLGDLAVGLAVGPDDGGQLRLGLGWPKRWTARVVTAAGEATMPVAELAGWSVPPGMIPLRRFSWARA